MRLLLAACVALVGCSGGSPDPGKVPADALGGDTALPDGAGQCLIGEPCDDGDPCTLDDLCGPSGACLGARLDCDDGLDCTSDGCQSGTCQHLVEDGYCVSELVLQCVPHGVVDPGNSCRACFSVDGKSDWLAAIDGAVCNDGDACTTPDRCWDGVCVPMGGELCVATSACVIATCEPSLGCVETPLPAGAPCSDGDACTEGDSCTATQECEPGPAVICDDGDACTNDVCHPVAGCQFHADACEDDDPCTEDSCSAAGGCSHVPFEGACEDGDLCTTGEVCVAGTCSGGQPVDCQDGNACTADGCEPSYGCVHLYVETDCDDGFACTSPDTCVAGQCVGQKQDCEHCPVPISDDAQKAVLFELTNSGQPGQGLDIDQDPATCQPAANCGEGIDNALAFLSVVVNPGLAQALENGSFAFVADVSQATSDGETFPFAIHYAVLSKTNPDCEVQSEVCAWLVTQILFDGGCSPSFLMEDARIVDGVLTAGGPDSTINLVLPLDLESGYAVPLTIAWARIEADVLPSPSGFGVGALEGIIGGAVVKSQLIAAVENADQAVLPFDKAQLVEILDQLIQPDLDLDGDGGADAASVAFAFRTMAATLVGP